jgi:hypothetical protein
MSLTAVQVQERAGMTARRNPIGEDSDFCEGLLTLIEQFFGELRSKGRWS